MVRNLLRVFSILTITALAVASLVAQGQELRYQVQKGVSHQYKLSTDITQKAQVMGQDMVSTINMAVDLSIEGQEEKDNQLVYVGKIDKNLSKLDSPMMKDSAMVYKEINGKRLQLYVTPVGKVTKTVALDSVPRLANPMMGNIISTEVLRGLFVDLPEKAVATGDTWKRTRPDTTTQQGMKMITKPDITFKVVGTETKNGQECLKITFEGTSTQYGTGSRQGMELVIDGTAKTKGTTYFAPKTGLLVSSEATSANEMNISGAGEQMFTMTQSMTTSSKITLVK